MSVYREAAVDYARRGWRVLPLRERDKAPRLREWPERASADPETVASWWSVRTEMNVGIATGRGLVVLDVDPRNGGDRTLELLEGQFRKVLPRTPEVLTGGGGRHIYFKADPRQPSGKVALRLGNGLDFQAAGRQVVAPPSIHPNGRQYVWHPERGIDTPLAELPVWLARQINWSERDLSPLPAANAPTGDGDDFLTSIAPPDYVRDLADLEVEPGGGKVRCPFHFDRTPSLHVYPTAKAGWYCYGCGVGGGIFQFAALVGGFTLPLRGAEFLKVEAALTNYYSKRLGVEAA